MGVLFAAGNFTLLKIASVPRHGSKKISLGLKVKLSSRLFTTRSAVGYSSLAKVFPLVELIVL
ncbi:MULTISPECIES: hypothetical protein [unclassified Pseudoalteromonas]|uniref:hypothetical protein n=1 Tax=unclassified Pseudoalteromonas TaxID=194690 RepID=UPI0012F85E25|nr:MULTISPECIES: hypothetical protein [unclassified Pseudoalteromonas]